MVSPVAEVPTICSAPATEASSSSDRCSSVSVWLLISDSGITTGSWISPIAPPTESSTCPACRLTPGPPPETAAELSAASEAAETTPNTDSLPCESAITVAGGATNCHVGSYAANWGRLAQPGPIARELANALTQSTYVSAAHDCTWSSLAVGTP